MWMRFLLFALPFQALDGLVHRPPPLATPSLRPANAPNCNQPQSKDYENKPHHPRVRDKLNIMGVNHHCKLLIFLFLVKPLHRQPKRLVKPSLRLQGQFARQSMPARIRPAKHLPLDSSGHPAMITIQI